MTDATPDTAAPRPPHDLVQVMVDTWGHRGEYIRGMVLSLADLNPDHYDHEYALRMGVVRRLTDAEAAVWPAGSIPTAASNPDGTLDTAHQTAMRVAAGILTDMPATITTESGPVEPAEFSKPTIAFTGDNQPSPRPVQVVSQSEAQANTNPRLPAAELVSRATAATSTAELDEIDSQADARMTTVHDAVAARRAELAQQG